MNATAEQVTLSAFPQTAVSEKEGNLFGKLLPSNIKAAAAAVSDTTVAAVAAAAADTPTFLTETSKEQAAVRQASLHNAEVIRDVLCILNSLCGGGGPVLLPPVGSARPLPPNLLGETAPAQLALLESRLFAGLKGDSGGIFQGKISTTTTTTTSSSGGGNSLLEKPAKVSRTSGEATDAAKPHTASLPPPRNHVTAYEADLIYPEALTKGQFICPNCGEDFLNRDALAMHMMESVHSEACISSASKENRQQQHQHQQQRRTAVAANAGLHSRLLPALMGPLGAPPTCSRRFFRLPHSLVSAAPAGRDPALGPSPPGQDFERGQAAATTTATAAELQTLFQGTKGKGSTGGLETTTRSIPKSESADCEKPMLSTGAKPGRKPRRLIYQRETIAGAECPGAGVGALTRSRPLRVAVRETRVVMEEPPPDTSLHACSSRPQATNGALTCREEEEVGVKIRETALPPKRSNSCELGGEKEHTSRPVRVSSTPARCDPEEGQMKGLGGTIGTTVTPAACKQRFGCTKTRGHSNSCAERKPPVETADWSTAPEGDPPGQKRRHSPDTRRPPPPPHHHHHQSLSDPLPAVATTHWNSGRSPPSTADRLKPFPYVCRHCQVGFEDQTLFSLHMGLHTSSNPWQCNMCSKVFGNVYEFTAHALHY